MILLAKLALGYWRPDFTPQQAAQLYAQYLDDLRDLPFSAIAEAVAEYRKDGENRFFPTSGQIRTLAVTPYSWETKSDRMRSLRVEAAKEKQTMLVQVGLPLLIGDNGKLEMPDEP